MRFVEVCRDADGIGIGPYLNIEVGDGKVVVPGV
jgi:hypothetical protein